MRIIRKILEILLRIVPIRICGLKYKKALEEGVIENDNRLNKILFQIAYYFKLIWPYFLFYIIYYFIIQLFESEGDICLDEYGSDIKNRFLYIIYGTLTSLATLLIVIKLFDFSYMIGKGIKNKLKKKIND